MKDRMENAPALIDTTDKTPEQMRASIVALESAMLESPLQIELKTTHHFAPGIYMREIFIPKGVTLTGKIHKTEHMNILSQGRLIVYTESGMKELTASTVVKSSPGIKRVGHALEDSVWITVHPNIADEQDVQKLEEMLVVDTFEQLDAFMESKQIEGGE